MTRRGIIHKKAIKAYGSKLEALNQYPSPHLLPIYMRQEARGRRQEVSSELFEQCFRL